MLETDRLILREYRPSDEPFFLKLFNDYDVLLNLTFAYVTPSSERPLDFIRRLCAAPLFVVAESKKTGAPLGFTNVLNELPQNLDGTVGIAIAKDWWGMGYGTEILEWLVSYSFKTLGLQRLSLQVFSSNPGAIALYEHVGFKHEGRQREAIWKDGKWVDVLLMGILAREYYSGNSLTSRDFSEGPAQGDHSVSSKTSSNLPKTSSEWVLI